MINNKWNAPLNDKWGDESFQARSPIISGSPPLGGAMGGVEEIPWQISVHKNQRNRNEKSQKLHNNCIKSATKILQSNTPLAKAKVLASET